MRPLQPLALLVLLAACATEPVGGLPDAGAGADAGAGTDAGPGADSGAGPDSGVAPDAGPETRLRAQSVRTLDGQAKRLLQLVDTTPGQPCWLTRFGSPSAPVLCWPAGSALLVFLDAACTKPYLETFEGDRPWLLAFTPLKVGAQVVPAPAQRYIGFAPGQCAAQPEAPLAPIYEIRDDSPAITLEEARIAETNPSPQLTVSYARTKDGARFMYEIKDRTSGTTCTPGLTSAGPRCIPDGALREMAVDEGLLDPSCQRLAVLDYGVAPVARVAARGGEFYRFEVAADRTHAGRLDARGQCQVEELQVSRRTLYFGVPYPATEWPVVGFERQGRGRVGARVGTLPSGERLEAESRVDQTRLFDDNGTPCGPAWVDGKLRCLPGLAEGVSSSAGLFADRRCTQPAVQIFGADVPPPSQITVLETYTRLADSGLPRGRVHRLGAEVREAYFGADCAPANPVGRAYVLGAEVPATQFAELELVTE